MAFLDKFKKQRPHGAKEKATAQEDNKKASALSAPKTPAKPLKEDTKEAYRVLLYPVVSEKASRIAEDNQYVFAVAMSATRIGVARAIMALYGVWPIKVNIIRSKGKEVRFGRTHGKQSDWKKAIVSVRAGEKLPVFEGI